MLNPPAETITRIHCSWLAERERVVLLWIATRMPARVDSDLLTMLGLFGAVLAGAAFVASWLTPYALVAACCGIVLTWFGDSLDGTLARVRGKERKRYGFFVDHTVDVASQVFIFLGLGLSPLMRLDAASLLLISYWLATLMTMIQALATGEFRVSYYGVGPTEIRLALLLYTIAGLLLGPLHIITAFGTISVIDIASIPIFLSVFSLFMLRLRREAQRLASEDRDPSAA